MKTMLSNFHVDDFLRSIGNEQDAVVFRKDLTELCAAGGFKFSR